MLDMLVNHPSTAKFIATKMLRWLLDPNPSDAQIATVASVYQGDRRRHQGDDSRDSQRRRGWRRRR